MLAYIVWHTVREGRGLLPLYESSLAEYHARLRRANLEGFLDSCTYDVGDLPWQPKKRCQESWFLLKDWTAFSMFAQAKDLEVVKPAFELVHHLSRVQGAAIYTHFRGNRKIRAANAHWFEKPDDVPAWTLDEMFDEPPSSEFGAWRRALDLGSTPEFCILSDGQFPLRAVSAWTVSRETAKGPTVQFSQSLNVNGEATSRPSTGGSIPIAPS